jgi:hypothetical protein
MADIGDYGATCQVPADLWDRVRYGYLKNDSNSKDDATSSFPSMIYTGQCADLGEAVAP